MHFCIIAPTCTLDRFAGQSKYHLVLAHECRRDGRYFEWYRARAKEHGAVVILDNGAYEGVAPDWGEYIKLAQELQPHVLTLPDKVGDWEETWRMMNEFLLRVTDRSVVWNGASPRMMGVVQHNGALEDWVQAYQQLKRVGNIGWIAFPRVLGPRRPLLISRLQQLQLLEPKRFMYHAFGMNAGSLDELQQLNALGVQSIDSSCAVWRGLHGYKLDGGVTPWPDIPFDARATEFVEGGFELAQTNLNKVLTLCRSKSGVV